MKAKDIRRAQKAKIWILASGCAHPFQAVLSLGEDVESEVLRKRSQVLNGIFLKNFFIFNGEIYSLFLRPMCSFLARSFLKL